MLKVKFSIGIDLANLTFVASVLIHQSNDYITKPFNNDEAGFKDFVKWMKKSKVTTGNSVIVMESTGVYSEKLCNFLYEKGCKSLISISSCFI